MKTKIIKIKNGDTTDIFKINIKTGAETGDLIYDKSEKRFYPVYMMGNTNICFTDEFQKSIHKVLLSTRKKDNIPFTKLLSSNFEKIDCKHKWLSFGNRDMICEKCGCYDSN